MRRSASALRDAPGAHREARGERHARGHRLPCSHDAVARRRLDRVPEGVAEVEQRARAGLALVLGDDLRLDLARAADRMGERLGVAREEAFRVRLDPREEFEVEDRAVLHHFGEARGEFARGQRGEGGGIRDHRIGLVEGAHHVLAERMVDRGLAAHRRVHLREERGGHLQVRDAALVGGRREAGDVADHAAAERDQDRPAVACASSSAAKMRSSVCQALVGLAVGQHDAHRARAARFQRGPPIDPRTGARPSRW
jgi:hypothetical protein